MRQIRGTNDAENENTSDEGMDGWTRGNIHYVQTQTLNSRFDWPVNAPREQIVGQVAL